MPANRRRSSGARFRSGQRRKLVWATKDIFLSPTAAGQTANLDMLSDLRVAGASILGATVMRTHLQLSAFGTVTAGNNFYFGLRVGNNNEVQAFTADTTLMADPANQPELDWMWWEHAQAAPVYDQGGTNILIRDIKAKRKVQELDQTYLLCLYSGTGFNSLQVSARTLVALP